jgi:hypothetical protein
VRNQAGSESLDFFAEEIPSRKQEYRLIVPLHLHSYVVVFAKKKLCGGRLI